MLQVPGYKAHAYPLTSEIDVALFPINSNSTFFNITLLDIQIGYQLFELFPGIIIINISERTQ